MTRFAIRGCLIAAAVTLTGAHCAADEPSLNAWFRQAMQIGTGQGLDGIRITYRRLPNGDMPSSDEIAALRARVEGRPDHPDRALLRMTERRLAGKAYHEAVVWRWRGEWRYNLTWPEDTGAGSNFLDRVWSADGSWKLLPTHLELVPHDSQHDAAKDHGLTMRGCESDLSSLLSGGVGLSKALARGLAITPEFTAATGRWRAQGQLPALSLEGEDRWTVEGSWTPAKDGSGAGVGTIDRCRFERRDTTGRVTIWEQVDTKGWRPIPGADAWIAEEADHSGSMAEMRRSIRLVDISGFSGEQFRALVAVPEPDGADPIRGASTFTSIVDLRGDEKRQIDRSAHSPLVLPPEPFQSSAQRERRLLVGGWILAGAIVSALVFLRMRRSGAQA